MLVKVYGSAVYGVGATTITIEVAVSQGIKFFLVGLPDNAIKESQQRIVSALSLSGFRMPGKKIVINLAPADIRKEGAAYDLPMALGILAASEQIPSERINEYLVMGELSLDGGLMPIRGALPIAAQALEEGFKGIILPSENAAEASIIKGLDVYGFSNLSEVCNFFLGHEEFSPMDVNLSKVFQDNEELLEEDFADVKGQESIKRAMEIAAAGGHNVLLIGPPGAGKTMLAKRLPGILPPITVEEALETTKIHSVAGRLIKDKGIITQRPFRNPHHTVSDVALVGGGGNPMPGEISLAHHGVLFLDELPEFKRTVLEVMRQPLEDRIVTISRARLSVDYPASFMLVASMNPCPCGFYNHPEKDCLCVPGTVQKYLNKISGPLLDRIDLHVEVTPVKFDELYDKRQNERSRDIRKRVILAREIQEERFRESRGIFSNAQMTHQQIKSHCRISDSGRALLKTAMERLSLSARAYDRILKVARTIADLDSATSIENQHLAEAIQLRSLDRENWSG